MMTWRGNRFHGGQSASGPFLATSSLYRIVHDNNIIFTIASMAFMDWACEAIPSATLRSAPEHQRPRVLRWMFKSNVRGSFTHLFDVEISCHNMLDLYRRMSGELTVIGGRMF